MLAFKSDTCTCLIKDCQIYVCCEHRSFNILQRAFRVGVPTRLDDRVYALEQCKTLPVSQLIQLLYPDLYPVHTIMEVVSSSLLFL